MLVLILTPLKRNGIYRSLAWVQHSVGRCEIVRGTLIKRDYETDIP